MNEVYAMLRLFGERYIFCDQEQALDDTKENRDNLVTSFSAIMEYVNLKTFNDKLQR